MIATTLELAYALSRLTLVRIRQAVVILLSVAFLRPGVAVACEAYAGYHHATFTSAWNGFQFIQQPCWTSWGGDHGGWGAAFAVRLPASKLASYPGGQINRVGVDLAAQPQTLQISVYSGAAAPTTLLYQSSLTPQAGYVSHTLGTPVAIGSEDLWVVFFLNWSGTLYPMKASCPDTSTPDGRWIAWGRFGGWQDSNAGRNWLIDVYASSADPGPANAGVDITSVGLQPIVLQGSVLSGGETGTWLRTAGPAGTFSSETSANTNFTPTGPGSYTLAWQTKKNFCYSTDYLQLTVNAPTIAVGPDVITGGTFGTGASISLSASGGTAPYTFAKLSGSFPSGWSLTGNTLAGTATAAGDYTFTLSATDAEGFSGSRTYAVQIGKIAQSIVFASLADREIGSAFDITAQGGASGNPVIFSVSTPSTCSASNANGSKITPTALGTCTVEATQAGNANFADAPPVQRSFQVQDTTAPETTISSAPTSLHASTSSTFVFSGTDSGGSGVSSFSCSIDGKPFTSCTSPYSLDVSDGVHNLAVRARDSAGNIDLSPATHSWTVDTTQPDTSFISTPATTSNSASAAFAIAGTDANAISFECSLDGAAFTACNAVTTLNGLAAGNHTFVARALDAAGNVDASPASFTWTVDTAAPTLAITSKPIITSANQASYSIAGTCSDDGQTVNVQIDSVATTATCGVPTAGEFATVAKDVSALNQGAVSLAASIADAAGNTTSITESTSKDTLGPSLTIGTLDAITNANKLAYAFAGNCESGGGAVSYTLTATALVTGAAACNAGGYAITGIDVTALLDGTVSFQVTQADALGNTSTTPGSVAKDTQNPSVTIDLPATIAAANAAGYGISGTCSETGATVSVSIGSVNGNAACGAAGPGFFQVSGLVVSSLADGNVAISASLRDTAGNSGSANAIAVKDTTSAAPVIGSPTTASTVGPNSTISGDGEIGATVTVREGGTAVCVATVGAAGTWSCTPALSLGAHSIVASQVDTAGNASADSAAVAFSVKATPTVALTSSVNPSTVGQGVAFTVSLAGTPAPSGPITFANGGVAITGCATLTLSGGQASCSTSALFAGTHTITAEYGGDGNYNASVSGALAQVVDTAPQSINFGALAPRTFGDAPFPVNATATSGLPVVFTSLTSAACTTGGANGMTVTLVGAGTCRIAADQAGDATYGPASQVTQSFEVSQASQSIVFGPLADRVFGAAAFTVSAVGGASGNPVIFTSLTTGVCTATGPNGATISIGGVGTCSIAANQAGSANYTAAAPVTQSFTVSSSSQSIAFGALPNKTFGDAPFAVSASGGPSSQPVVFASSTPAVCSSSGANGSIITLVAAGTCSIVANQAGDGTYTAATPVVQSFLVAKAAQAINFGTLPDRRMGDAAFSISATASSGLAVTFSSSTPATCSVSGSSLTLVAAGTCTIVASQAGDGSFLAAADVFQSFSINPALPGLSLGASAIDFGGQSVRTTSRDRVVTLTNTGQGVLNVAATSANPPFEASHLCGSVNPGGTCPISVRFTPSMAGAAAGTLTITHNATGGSATVSLSGTGELSLITHFFDAILARLPNADGKAFWEGEAARLHGLGANVNETWFAMALAFFNSPEYAAQGNTDPEFLADLYRTFFNRAADAGGLDYWAQLMLDGLSRENVLQAFMFSAEFSRFTNDIFGEQPTRMELNLVMDFYRGALGRLPETEGFRHWLGRLRGAQCSGGDAVQVEVDSLSQMFLYSPEYANRQRTNREYVADLYNMFMRRGGDMPGEEYWVKQLVEGAMDREQLRRAFLDSAEFQFRLAAVSSLTCIFTP
ncbi:MAG TPA: DUF4214 domain-containing protein [Usitatibacter sp.]|nr:DUF4214 domain-containing protein [Usitatibacter sp.]